jgi:F-type H+-transporting ATPase subunit delta
VLSAAEQNQFKTRLRDTLKRQVEVTFQTDVSYLAGVRIQIGSAVVDSTVSGRLKDIQGLLTRD